MNNDETIVYSINMEDLQTVAEEEFGRKLTAKELRLVGNKLGDFIGWHDAVANAIQESLELEFVEEE
jgi:hypothetical protein